MSALILASSSRGETRDETPNRASFVAAGQPDRAVVINVSNNIPPPTCLVLCSLLNYCLNVKSFSRLHPPKITLIYLVRRNCFSRLATLSRLHVRVEPRVTTRDSPIPQSTHSCPQLIRLGTVIVGILIDNLVREARTLLSADHISQIVTNKCNIEKVNANN